MEVRLFAALVACACLSHASEISETDELLLMATVQNDANAVRDFLEAGVGADVASGEGVTVLMMASMLGHVEVAKRLLRGGATIEAIDDHAHRPLMLAASYGKVDSVRLLLDNGADVHARNKQGQTALMLATVEGQAAAARVLIEEGAAALDAADLRGDQALMLAARKGGPDLTRLLLSAGAPTEARNHEGMTPLMVAASVVHTKEQDSTGQLAVLSLLLAARANIEAEDHERGTPLMVAAAAGSARVVRLLLQNGAKVDAIDARGLSAMELAMRGAHDECMDVLQDALHGQPSTNTEGRPNLEKEEM